MTTNELDGVNYTGNVGKPSVNKSELCKKLSGKKMKELQDFGRKYGAKDTSKKELIDEIISKAPDKDTKEFLEGE
ncbi:hypothetical protein LCGC14_1083250 [marine sediment metagenome]|uniref:Rho termination factor N-terminal domain-containing protein n=1 Tax=marine sediment metagenome TaxID=412755 RepID=A0A0F9MER8_9ZZZZ